MENSFPECQGDVVVPRGAEQGGEEEQGRGGAEEGAWGLTQATNKRVDAKIN